ncbi:MAG: ABC transporter ATP-binding protein [Hyphomicrobium sp.]
MTLELKNVTKRVGADTYIYETNLVLADAGINVLLGATLAGKTTLMQLMAGLERPTSGEIWFRGKNVTGVPVQKRNVSMVYQQFINYPNLSVRDNIATPLRVAGFAADEMERRVAQAADLLRLTPMHDRRPSELAGGQQQRTAIARAIVKDSDLILFDEPLANLDYKLREELRDELPKLFADRKCIVVYATTDPSEALMFGGQTATLHEGRVTQFGPTAQGYRRPRDLISAKVFSDPPINTHKATKRAATLQLEQGPAWGLSAKGAQMPDGEYTIAVRPHHVTPAPPGASSGTIDASVIITEISGSESVIHFSLGGKTWVSQSHGIHRYEVGAPARLYVDTDQILYFKPDGELVG